MAAEPLPVRTPESGDTTPAARNLRAAAEAVALALVAISPWPFGSVQPFWEFALLAGVAVLAGLWAAHAAVTGRFAFRPDAVSACLLGLVLLAALQLVPLPAPAVRVLSPTLSGWNQSLRPEVGEVLPGESGPGRPRPDWLPLSIDPAATQDTLARLLAVFLAYAVTRNLVASKESFRRLAWVGFANGLLLAVLALAQLFSSGQSKIYWSVVTVNESFGPFVNKNHYPFYESLCVGLGLGLLVLTVRRSPGSVYRDELADEGRLARALGDARDAIRSPRVVGLLAGLGLMLASVPLSRSRGGLSAVVAAGVVTAAVGWWSRARGEERGRTIGLVVWLVAVAVGMVAWFGWAPIEGRVATLWRGTADNRTPIWRELVPVAYRFPLTGTGLGTIARAEQAFRTRSDAPRLILNSLANEYLEAAVEGGVFGAVLTVGLAVAAVVAAVGGAGRLRGRSAGAMLLGCVFGLTAVAVHSIGDFGLHIPAVALLAAVVAGQAVAASADTKPGERKKRRSKDRGQESGDGGQPSRSRDAERSAEPERARPVAVSGPAAYAAAVALVLVGIQPAWAAWRTSRAERLRAAADAVARSEEPDRWAQAVVYLEAATRLRPADAELWNALAAAHLAAAQDNAAAAAAAVAGPAAVARPPEEPLPDDVAAHVVPALRAARAARDRCPLLPGPHLRLGTYSRSLAQGEPAAAHFARAKQVAPYDPDVWYLSGAAALARGDLDAAWADWKECLARSPRRLGPVVRQASRHLSPELLRARLLPDDPTVWVAALEHLDADPETRRAWLRAAAARWTAGPEPDRPAGWLAWATADEQLGDPAGALALLRRAADRFPDSAEVRDRLAAVLQAEELDEEAVGHLEWLVGHRPDSHPYRDRLDAARHAVELRKTIESP